MWVLWSVTRGTLLLVYRTAFATVLAIDRHWKIYIYIFPERGGNKPGGWGNMLRHIQWFRQWQQCWCLCDNKGMCTTDLPCFFFLLILLYIFYSCLWFVYKKGQNRVFEESSFTKSKDLCEFKRLLICQGAHW